MLRIGAGQYFVAFPTIGSFFTGMGLDVGDTTGIQPPWFPLPRGSGGPSRHGSTAHPTVHRDACGNRLGGGHLEIDDYTQKVSEGCVTKLNEQPADPKS